MKSSFIHSNTHMLFFLLPEFSCFSLLLHFVPFFSHFFFMGVEVVQCITRSAVVFGKLFGCLFLTGCKAFILWFLSCSRAVVQLCLHCFRGSRSVYDVAHWWSHAGVIWCNVMKRLLVEGQSLARHPARFVIFAFLPVIIHQLANTWQTVRKPTHQSAFKKNRLNLKLSRSKSDFCGYCWEFIAVYFQVMVQTPCRAERIQGFKPQ